MSSFFFDFVAEKRGSVFRSDLKRDFCCFLPDSADYKESTRYSINMASSRNRSTIIF